MGWGLQRGTLEYMAPELMGYRHGDGADSPHPRHSVTTAVDIYSFGIVLWSILTGDRPRLHEESLRKPRYVKRDLT